MSGCAWKKTRYKKPKSAARLIPRLETPPTYAFARRMPCRYASEVPQILDPQSADLAQCAGLLDDGQIEIVSTQRLGQNLLAQVAVTPGLTKIYEDLLTFGHETNEIWGSPVPKSLVGKPIDDVFFALFKLRQKNVQIIPIAISRQSKILLNPCSSKNGNLEEGDELFAICDNRAQLKELDGLFHKAAT